MVTKNVNFYKQNLTNNQYDSYMQVFDYYWLLRQYKNNFQPIISSSFIGMQNLSQNLNK